MKKYKGYLSGLGGLLVHFTLGTMYCWGNIDPYVISYIRKHSHPSTISYGATVWVFSLTIIGEGMFMSVGGVLQGKIGTRLATLTGCFIASLGVFLSAFTVQVSYYLFLLTYGFMFGVGIGMAYVPPLGLAMAWFVKNQGVASGCLVAGIGVGGVIFNEIQTAFLNPLNIEPVGVTELNFTQNHDSDKYFIDESILNRVPSMFMMMGGCCFAIQLVGVALLFPVESDNSNEDQELLVKKKPANHAELSRDPDEIEHNLPEDAINVKPKEMIKTRAFLILWCMFFLLNISITFITTLYKTYGESEVVDDDRFLTILGASAAFFNAVGRPLWGLLADKVSFKIAVTVLCAVLTCLMGSLYVTHVFADTAGKPLLFIWICLIFLTFSGSFSLFPAAISKAFGPQYVSINYGILFTARAASGLIGAFLCSLLLQKINTYGIFILSACLTAIAFVLALVYTGKTQDGKTV